jgi:hypothetical protein
MILGPLDCRPLPEHRYRLGSPDGNYKEHTLLPSLSVEA